MRWMNCVFIKLEKKKDCKWKILKYDIVTGNPWVVKKDKKHFLSNTKNYKSYNNNNIIKM